MSNNKLVILGSSSGLPQAGRASSGYLLKTGETLSLIECGGGVTSSFLRRGFDPLDVGQVFISHTHPDHVTELPLFIQLAYLAGRTEPLDLYLPAEFVEPFRRFLLAVYLIPEKLPFEVNLIGYEQGVVYDKSFVLTAVGNRHLLGNRELIEQFGLPNRMQCFSMDIKVGGKSLFYSADIASYDDVRAYVDDKDIVILESTHIDLGDFFDHASTVNVGRFVITHLGTDQEVAEINRLAAKAGVDNLVTAVDGLDLEI